VSAEVLAQATQVQRVPGVIDLGIGQPQDAILPLELMARAMRSAAEAGRREPLQYGAEHGSGALRSALAAFLTAGYGTAVDPDRLLISNGNSQAIDLCSATLTCPGDVVFVEEPTYFLALQIFADHGLRVVGIPVDEEGVRIDALEAALAQESPKFFYCIPTGHNPTGSTMPAEHRRRLVELAREHGFLVLADEVYQLLTYAGTAPEPLAAQVDSGAVISLGTFSKILAPGLRLGWVQAPTELLQRLASRGQLISGGGLNPVVAALVAPILDDGGVADYLDRLRLTLGGRLTTMAETLQQCLPSAVSYRRPEAGYFFWLQLPEHIDTSDARPAALASGVGFQPGRLFSTRGGLGNCMRLSFAYYDEAEIRAGVAKLGQFIATSWGEL
jgi:2-aminoadipate transaminase